MYTNCVCSCVHALMCVYVHAYTCEYVCVCLCMHTYVWVCLCVLVHVWVCVYLGVYCVHVCMTECNTILCSKMMGLVWI